MPNWMFSNGQHRQEPTDEEDTKTAGLWGPDLVHPTSVAGRVMEGSLETDIQNPDAHYTKPAKQQPVPKKARYDPSQDLAGWVNGCSAALPRRELAPLRPPRGQAAGGSGWKPHIRGHLIHGHFRASGGDPWKVTCGNGHHQYIRGGGGGATRPPSCNIAMHQVYITVLHYDVKVIMQMLTYNLP
jgi:hypothetical protein